MRLGELVRSGRLTVIDGGLSTALEEAGYRLSDSLWTARLLADDPAAITAAHRSFVRAGAEVVISASYQASVDGLMSAGHERSAAIRLIQSSTNLARAGGGSVTLASVGPYGAALADGSEYTGTYDKDETELRNWHRERIAILSATHPDGLAVETIPSASEARALAPLLENTGLDSWVTFTCGADGRLRSSEDVRVGAAAVVDLDSVVAIGVNCTSPEDVSAALARIRAITDLPLVVYPNLGRTWDPLSKKWAEAGRTWSVAMVEEWVGLGTQLVGGCCGTGPADIERLKQAMATLSD